MKQLNVGHEYSFSEFSLDLGKEVLGVSVFHTTSRAAQLLGIPWRKIDDLLRLTGTKTHMVKIPEDQLYLEQATLDRLKEILQEYPSIKELICQDK